MSHASLKVLPDARFACQSSGMCCSGYVYGPIEDAVVKAVSNHVFGENADVIAAASPFVETHEGGKTRRTLRTVRGRCVFLSADDLCLIHKEIGAHAKPAVCRLFPYVFARAPDGTTHVSLNMECGGYASGRAHAPLLSEQIDKLTELAAEVPAMHVVAPTVRLAPGRDVPFSDFVRLEEAWLAGLTDSDQPVADHARAVCRQTLTFLNHSALVSGSAQHGHTFAERLASQPICTAIAAVRDLTRHWMVEERAAGNAAAADLCTKVMMGADALLDPSAVCTPALKARARALNDPLASADPEVRALFRDQLRHVIFSKRLGEHTDVLRGLALEVLKLAIAASTARVLAAATQAARLDSDHVNEGLRAVNRVLRHPVLLSALAETPDVPLRIVESLATHG